MKKHLITLFAVTLLIFLLYNNYRSLKSEVQSIINVYQYLQCGQTWSSSQLGTCSGLTICSDGCAIVCMSMLLKTNGVNVNPGQLNTWLTNNGGYSGGCLIIWNTAVQYPGSTITFAGSPGYSLSTIKSKIDTGNPVIVNVTTSVNHFIVVKGYNGSGTNSSDFIVLDPLYQSERLLSNYSTIVGLRTFNNVTSLSGYAKVSQGVAVIPNPIIRGGSLQSTFTLLETGGAQITFDTVVCAILNNSSAFQFNLTRANNISIPAGGTYNYNATGYFSSTLPLGTYKAVARGYKSGTGWFDFTTTGSGQNPLSFQVIDNPSTPNPPVLVSPGTLTSPGPFIATLTPTMQWNAGTGATRYGLYIRNMSTSILVFDNETITGTSFSIPSGILENSNQYRWNMRSFSGSGQSSDYTSPFYFQSPVALLPPPVLINPSGTIYTTIPTFLWQSVSGAAKYGLYVSIAPYGSSNIVYSNENVPSNATSFTIPSGFLLFGNQYRWNMGTYNSNAQLGSIAAPLYFQTQSPSGIVQIQEIIPTEFELYQSYPNPFNPITNIRFDIPDKSDIILIIYDVRGSEVLSFSEFGISAGQYIYRFDGSNLSTGIYFCKLSANHFSKTIKLNLVK